jgi:hypothetical protein
VEVLQRLLLVIPREPLVKTIECHAPDCRLQLAWSPSSPSEIFVPEKTLRQHGWILFRGDPYCLPCGVQTIANYVEEIQR